MARRWWGPPDPRRRTDARSSPGSTCLPPLAWERHTDRQNQGARLRVGSRNRDRSSDATWIIHSSGSVARALPAVDVKGLSGHEGGRFEIKDGVHDVGDLTHSAD